MLDPHPGEGCGGVFGPSAWEAPVVDSDRGVGADQLEVLLRGVSDEHADTLSALQNPSLDQVFNGLPDGYRRCPVLVGKFSGRRQLVTGL
jgi:hypothetical protein